MGQTLVIHPGALGDVLLAVPALRALRRIDRDNDLVLAAQSPVGELLHVLGVVDVRLRFDLLGLDALFSDAPHDADLSALAGASRVVCWFGSRDPDFARRLRAVVPNAVVAPSVVPDRLVWEHLHATVAGDDRAAVDPIVVPARFVEDGYRALVAAAWDGSRPILLVHPGASGPAKRWPVEGFARVVSVASAAGLTVVVHEGPADREPVRELAARASGRIVRLDNPSLAVLAGALRHVTAYVGNDTGVSHVAAAVGVPSVVLFTSGTLAWRPWARGASALVVSTASFYPEDADAVVDALRPILA